MTQCVTEVRTHSDDGWASLIATPTASKISFAVASLARLTILDVRTVMTDVQNSLRLICV